MRYAIVVTNAELVKRFKQACAARKLSPGAFATILLDEHLPPLPEPAPAVPETSEPAPIGGFVNRLQGLRRS